MTLTQFIIQFLLLAMVLWVLVFMLKNSGLFRSAFKAVRQVFLNFDARFRQKTSLFFMRTVELKHSKRFNNAVSELVLYVNTVFYSVRFTATLQKRAV